MTKTCSTCGAEIPASAAGGHCPRCLWSFALAPAGEPAPSKPSRSIQRLPEEKPGDFIGRYQLLSEIGQGGCGIVYEAEQTEPVRRRVALKIIKLGMDTRRVIARFEAERQVLALMDHPNIARIFDAGATAVGRPFFVLELVTGARITAYCDRRHLATKDRLALFCQVCDAIQHAHHKGIIHRDLKPSNVLVAEPGPGAPALPKVIDFGIAKVTGDQPLAKETLFTARDQFLGTPAYMSPEQASLGRVDVDARTDIYSLGVLLYELLTGTTPFDAATFHQGTIEEILRVIREEEPPSPSTRLTTLSPKELARLAGQRQSEPARLPALLRGDLDWIVMKCLDKDRSRRYDSAASLARDLQRHLASEPVLAHAPTTSYRLRKFVRRNRVAVVATAAVVLSLIAGLTVSTLLLIEARRAHEQAIALASSNFSQAVRLIEAGNRGDALAYLARGMALHPEADPAHDAFRTCLASLLTYDSWTVPNIVVTNGGSVEWVGFTPNGRHLLALSDGGTARVFDAASGAALTGPWSTGSLWLDPRAGGSGFSPSGALLLAAGPDHTVRLLDSATGQPAVPPLSHPGDVVIAQFSPDGKRLLTVCADGTARVWDARSGEALSPPMKPDRQVRFARFSPLGDQVLTAGGDNTARLWDAQTGELLFDTFQHQLPLQDAQFSPDGRRIVTASLDGTARVWDAQTGEARTPPLEHAGPVTTAGFSPDGRWVVTASQDTTARLWNAETGEPAARPMRHNGQVVNARFSPDGRRIATASWDNTARIWDAGNAQPASESLRHQSRVNAAEFSPDGRRLVTASHDGTGRVWDTLSAPAQALFLGSGALSPLPRFSPDGKRVLTVSVGGVAQLWEATGEGVSAPPLVHEDAVVSVQFSPTSPLLVTVSADGFARVWDTENGRSLAAPARLGESVRFAQLSPSATSILTLSPDGSAQVWAAATGRAVGPPFHPEPGLRLAEFSADDRWILTASTNLTAQVWATDTGRLAATLASHKEALRTARFSPDARRVVTASRDGTAIVWDARSGKALLPPLNHSDMVAFAEFSPDGTRIATASRDYTARVWDAQTGTPLTGPLLHASGVTMARFSPDGRRVVTASGDGAARVWDSLTGQPLSEPWPHGNQVISAEFSPDGTRALTVSWDGTSADGTVRVWDIAPVGECPPWLLPLAEAVSGEVLNARNVLEPSQLDRAAFLDQLRRRLSLEPPADPWVTWGRWFLADPAERTIAPFSKRK